MTSANAGTRTEAAEIGILLDALTNPEVDPKRRRISLTTTLISGVLGRSASGQSYAFMGTAVATAQRR